MSTKTKNTAAPKNSKKAKDAELAKGAAAIKAAKEGKTIEFDVLPKDDKTPEMVAIVPSERPVEETIQQYVHVREGGLGLDIDPGLPVEEWVTLFSHYNGMQKHIQFLMADLIRFADSTYGNKYTAAVKATGLEAKTLQNYVSVAKAIPADERVLELGYSHHSVVSALPKKDRTKLLNEAKKEKLSVAELTKRVKEVTPPKKEKATKSPAKKAAAGKGEKTLPEVNETLSGEVSAENDNAIELADQVTTYLRSGTFAKLPRAFAITWQGVLKPIAEKYEQLLKQHPVKGKR